MTKLIHNVGDDDGTLQYCDRCQNTGYMPCYCGGDQCFCDYQGEKPCSRCELGEEFFD